MDAVHRSMDTTRSPRILRRARIWHGLLRLGIASLSLYGTTAGAQADTPTPTITPRPTATPGAFATVGFSKECLTQNDSRGIGVGIAFDGEHLWYSCWRTGLTEPADPGKPNFDLHKANPLTGAVIASYNIAQGLGGLAYDAKRNGLWAGWGGPGNTGKVYFIPFDASKLARPGEVEIKFNVNGHGIVFDLNEGLAYDNEDETLYVSDDGSTTITQYTLAGAILRDFSWAGQPCADPSGGFNSGLAIGGMLLYQGANGCNHVWVVDKADPFPYDAADPSNFDFSTTLVNDTNFRDEDLECDTVTFAAQGRHVMWSVEAYSPRRAKAFEIPLDTCGIGGNPPGTPPPTAAPTATATPVPLKLRPPGPGSGSGLLAPLLGLALAAFYGWRLRRGRKGSR